MNKILSLALGLALAFGAATTVAAYEKSDDKKHDKKDNKDHKDEKKKKDH